LRATLDWQLERREREGWEWACRRVARGEIEVGTGQRRRVLIHGPPRPHRQAVPKGQLEVLDYKTQSAGGLKAKTKDAG